MSKVAVLFPGQGSQFNNMGEDFRAFEQYQRVQSELFTAIPNTKDALEGSLDINQTIYAQPILFANQVGILEVIKSKYNLDDVVYGGFSLGEYSSYYATGKYNLELGLKIIEERSKLMASVESTYVTKVILGLTKDSLSTVVYELNKGLENPAIISNYNSEKQLLLNFEANDSEVVTIALKEAGAKRVMDLAVSGPFHTNIFTDAADQFQQFVSSCDLKPGTNNLYLNLTGRKYNSEELSLVMHDHMLTGVQWLTEIESMIADGVDTFVELGSKSVVAGMVKKINRKVNIITIEKADDLEKLEGIWNKK